MLLNGCRTVVYFEEQLSLLEGGVMVESGWREHIVSTPDVLRGKPRIKGTRIPVSLVLGYLAAGKSVEEIIGEFPDLEREQIAACLDYARDLSEYEVAV
jgi:uncharacterized protein (DUF433 family)